MFSVMGGFAKDWLAERKDQDQPEKASPGLCPAMTPSNRPPSSAQDASPGDTTSGASPDLPVGDAMLCEGTPNHIGSEACPTAPFQADFTPCHDLGRDCAYADCGDLVSCACRDPDNTGQPIWQCAVLLH